MISRLALALLATSGLATLAQAAEPPPPILVAVPPVGAEIGFSMCDGYAAPTPASDGLNQPLRAMPGPLASSPAGAATEACDKALADPALLPTYWARRLSLIEARALLAIELGHIDAAEADLRTARALVAPRANDRAFRHSGAVGLDLIAADIALAKGQPAQAQTLWLAVGKARPCDPILHMTLLARLSATAAPADLSFEEAGRAARLGPGASVGVLTDLLNRGRGDEALALAQDFDVADLVAKTPLNAMDPRFVSTLAFRMTLSALELRLAYWRLGQRGQGGPLLELETTAAIRTATEAQFPRKGGFVDFAARQGLGKEMAVHYLAEGVRQWTALVAARDGLAALQPATAGSLLDASRMFPVEASALLEQVAAGTPASMAPQDTAALAAIRARRAEIAADLAAQQARVLAVRQTFALLPRTAYAEIASHYRYGGTGLFSKGYGFKIEPGPNDTYVGTYTPDPGANGSETFELALLGLAEAARERHLDNIEVLDFSSFFTRGAGSADVTITVTFRPRATSRTLAVADLIEQLEPVYRIP